MIFRQRRTIGIGLKKLVIPFTIVRTIMMIMRTSLWVGLEVCAWAGRVLCLASFDMLVGIMLEVWKSVL